mgnify:CR=1 FL=1
MKRAMSALWPSLLSSADVGRPDLCVVSATGTRLTFLDGVERLCATSGLWNVPLGYGDQVIAEVIARTAVDNSYASVFRYESVEAREAANQLIELCGPDHFKKIFFSTSGGAANDMAMKLVRQVQALRGYPQKKMVVGLQGSYHGLTHGAFALTGEELGQPAYGIDRRLVRHVDSQCPEQLSELLSRTSDQIAAVVVEPLSGSGTIPLSDEFLAVLAESRERHGFVLVADEVATGFARTGPMFASQEWPVPPDLLIMSKALTNGTCAAAAIAVSDEIARDFDARDAVLMHAETQAGTAITCAAIIATLSRLQSIDAESRVRALESELVEGLDDVVQDVPGAATHNGRGAFHTLSLVDSRGKSIQQSLVCEVVDFVRREGVVVHPGLHGIQIVPGYLYTVSDIAELFGAIRRGLTAWYEQKETA